MDPWRAICLPKVIWNRIHRSKGLVDLLKHKKSSKNIHKKMVAISIIPIGTISTWKLKSSRTLRVKWPTMWMCRSFTMFKETTTTQMRLRLTTLICLSNNNPKTVSNRGDLCTMRMHTTKLHRHPHIIRHSLSTRISNCSSSAMAMWLSTLLQRRRNYHQDRKSVV